MTPDLWEVRRRHRESADTVTLSIAPIEGAIPEARPGQFNMLSVFGLGEVPISLSGDLTNNDTVLHTIRGVGAVSKALETLRVGDLLGVRGPFGLGWEPDDARGDDVVILAGGIGLAPLKPVIHHVLRHKAHYGRLVILYGARRPAELILEDALERWQTLDGVQVRVTVDLADAEWRGHVGLVTKLIPHASFDPLHTSAFVCGPEVMMRFGAQALTKAGVRDEKIRVSLERNMKCGIGHCGHCQYGPLFCCKDGPVVDFATAKPLFEAREL
jgi:NAD(P)H-flavin reductase